MKKFIIVMLFIVTFISCDNQTSKVDDTNVEGIKIQIQNNTNYELKKFNLYDVDFGDLLPGQKSEIKVIFKSSESNTTFSKSDIYLDGKFIDYLDQFYSYDFPPENRLVILDSLYRSYNGHPQVNWTDNDL